MNIVDVAGKNNNRFTNRCDIMIALIVAAEVKVAAEKKQKMLFLSSGGKHK